MLDRPVSAGYPVGTAFASVMFSAGSRWIAVASADSAQTAAPWGACDAVKGFDRPGRALPVRTAAGRMRPAHHRHAARLPGARRLWRDAGQRRIAAAADDRAQSPAAGGLARRRTARDAHPRGPSARP